MRYFFLLSVLFCSHAVLSQQTHSWSLTNITEDPGFKTFMKSKKVIVLGEIHGTNEVPAVFETLIHCVSNRKKTIQVALEIEENLQEQVDEFMKTGDLNKLITNDYFKTPDGRTSFAMGELLKKLQKMGNVKVICFDTDSRLNITNPVVRDSLMGLTLARKYNEGNKLIMLTGNLHANLTAGYWKPGFKSATLCFKERRGLGNELVSLNTYFDGGTLWNCMQDGCKERASSSTPGISDKLPGNFLRITDQVDDEGYNGFVFFQQVSASRPMIAP